MSRCVIADCSNETGARRWFCGMHNERMRRLGTTYIHREQACSRCDRQIVAKGLCRSHYMKLERTGTFSPLRRPAKSGGRTHREKHLLNRYAMTLEQYAEIEMGQDGHCAICDEPQPAGSMFVDHDHETGAVRGLLCRGCNTLLGMVENREDPDRVLLGALAYCDGHQV